MKAGIEAFVPAQKYHVKLQSSSWFTPAYSVAIAQKNHFFQLYQCDTSDQNRHHFLPPHNEYTRVLNEAKSLFIDRIRQHIASHKLCSRTIMGKLHAAPLVFLDGMHNYIRKITLLKIFFCFLFSCSLNFHIDRQ